MRGGGGAVRPGGAVVQSGDLQNCHRARSARSCCALQHRVRFRRQCGGRLLLPACSDKLGRKPVLYAVYLGLAAGSVWFAFAAEWWVLAAYAVLTFFYSGGAAVQPAFNTDLFGLPTRG